MTPGVAHRLATLERQLSRYLASPLPPVRHPYQGARRMTYQRRVVRDYLRQMRAWRSQGHLRGWRYVSLTTEDEARFRELEPQLARRAYGIP
jgi:hypothetical protein